MLHAQEVKAVLLSNLYLSHIVSRIMINNLQVWEIKADLKSQSFYLRFKNSVGKWL